MPPEIERLVGRRYVVKVTVSRMSLRRERIDFQVLKCFSEGRAPYADFSLTKTSLDAHTSVPSSTRVSADEAGCQITLPDTSGVAASVSLEGKEVLEDQVFALVKENSRTGKLVAHSAPPRDVLEISSEDNVKSDNATNNKVVEIAKKRGARWWSHATEGVYWTECESKLRGVTVMIFCIEAIGVLCLMLPRRLCV